MKHLLLTTIAAVLVVGCGESQQSTPAPEPQTAKAPDISIHEAAIKGNIEAVKQHIAAGTDLNAKYLRDGYQGGTPLYYAVNANKEIVELLLANGADVNAKDNTGLTPLHRASAKDDTGLTPLTEALTKEIVELLITNGADVNAKNKNGDTPIDFAVRGNQTATIDLLRKHGGKTREELKAEGK